MSQTTSPEIAVSVAGFGWMGRVHTNAYLRQPHHFPEVPRIRLAAVADEVPGRADGAAAQFGFDTALIDWRDIAADPTIDAVSITAPNFLHREIGVAMAEAGKHIWIEKPVGLSSADAMAVAAAAEKAGVQSTVGFNYRHAPAVALAQELIASGELGTITHSRFRFLSDYAAHPEGALSWRYERSRGGSGVLGDLASHGVDLIRYLLGDIDAVVADTAIFIPQRAVPTGATSGHARATGGELGPVENDDFVSALLRLSSGGRVTLDASRVAVGEQNNYGFEIHGTEGAVYWDFRRMNELGTSLGNKYQDQPITNTWVGPDAGAYARFQPGSASSMSYDDLKVIEGNNFISSIVSGKPVGATLTDAVAAAQVLDAITASVASGGWVGATSSL